MHSGISSQKKFIITNTHGNAQKLYITKIHVDEEILDFVRFFSKDGLLTKERILFCGVIRNLNYFFYQNCNFLYASYPDVK